MYRFLLDESEMKDCANFISFAEREGAYLAESFSDIPASVLSRLNPTAEKSCSNDNATESFQGSQFGTTCEPSTENPGVANSTFCAGEVHALESAVPAQTILPLGGLELTVEALNFFTVTSELLARHNRRFVFGKLLQQSPLKGLKRSSPLLTRWGITRDGECLSAAATVQTMSGNGCFLLPTPTAHNAKEGAYPAEYKRNTPTLAAAIGGKINPDWNEWRMGWPIKWTDLEPLGMDKFQTWLRLHGKHLQAEHPAPPDHARLPHAND